MSNYTYETGQKNAKGWTICGAKTRAGHPCQVTALMENGRCRVHGGATPKGIASPSFKTGKHSKYVLPPRYRARYDAALQDSDYLKLQNEIAVLDARIGALLEAVDTRDVGALYKQLQDSAQDMEMALRIGDTEMVARRWLALKKVINEGVEDSKVWDEIRASIQDRRALVATERQLLKDMEQTLQVGEALSFARQLLLAVRENVNDQKTLQAIQSSFIRISEREAVVTE